VESSDGHRTATPAPASPWLPLRTRIFLALFIAQLASNLGSLMHSVAAAWLMGDLGASAALVALVQTATFLPVVLVGMPAGALADVFDRRRLLIVTQSMMMGSAALMAALTFAHHITPVGVLGLTFLLGTGFALTGPAWSAIQPDLVPAEQFSQAVALNSMTYNVGRAVGPAVGGLVVAGFGAQWVFLLNAVSFIGTIAVVYAWRPVPRLATSLPAETFAGATRAGLRYGSNSPLLRAVLVRSGLLVLPGSALQALLPVVVRSELHLGSNAYGLLLGCFGAGASLAAVVRPRLTVRVNADGQLVYAALVMAGALLVQGYVHQPVLVGAALVVAGFWFSLATIVTNVAAQTALPAWVRARGMALYMLVLTGGVALGSALSGVLANVDIRLAHLIAAVGVALSVLASKRWSLAWPGPIDLSVVPGDEPTVALVPRPNDGPVLVTVTYRVPTEDLGEFTDAMAYVERHRRRTGAFRWGLFRDLAAPDRFVESFVVSSWAEHLRQHQRQTASTTERLAELRRWIDPDSPVHHYLSTASASGLAPHEAPVTERFTEEV